MVNIPPFEHAPPQVPPEHDHKPGAEPKEEEKADKVAVVFIAHTIVDPRAMVIHFEDTRVAERAVVRAHGLDDLAWA